MPRKRGTGAMFAIGVGYGGQLVTEWSTNNEVMARVLRNIEAMREPERSLAEADLHMAQARWLLLKAGRLEAPPTGRNRPRGKYARGTCPACGVEYSVNTEGRVRPHGPPSDRPQLRRPDFPSRCVGSRAPAATIVKEDTLV